MADSSENSVKSLSDRKQELFKSVSKGSNHAQRLSLKATASPSKCVKFKSEVTTGPRDRRVTRVSCETNSNVDIKVKVRTSTETVKKSPPKRKSEVTRKSLCVNDDSGVTVAVRVRPFNSRFVFLALIWFMNDFSST